MSLIIRTYQAADYQGIISLFEDAYTGIDDNFADFETMEKLRLHYPAAQIVACKGEEIVGCILSLFCPYEQFSQPRTMSEIYDPANFDAFASNGDSLFALEILVKSNQQRQGIGKKLNQYIFNLLKTNNLRAFIGVSRLTGYGALQSQLSTDEYLRKVSDGEIFDPALSFNCANNMLPTQAIADYYPADSQSAGFGALVIQKNPYFGKTDQIEQLLGGKSGLVQLCPEAFLTETERLQLLQELRQTPFTFEYEGMPSCWGRGFENFLSLEEYLRPSPADELLEKRCRVFNQKIVQILENKGIKVETLKDEQSGKPYAVGNFREGQNPPWLTMLHVDKLDLDGQFKADFRLPASLQGQDFYQLSFMLMLAVEGKGCLRIYDRKYQPSDEQYKLENGWQFAEAAVAGAQYLDYEPQVGDIFLMPNHHFHDILTQEQAAKWLYYSLYVLYLPSSKQAFLYI